MDWQLALWLLRVGRVQGREEEPELAWRVEWRVERVAGSGAGWLVALDAESPERGWAAERVLHDRVPAATRRQG